MVVVDPDSGRLVWAAAGHTRTRQAVEELSLRVVEDPQDLTARQAAKLA
jgi:hypothetical protein